VRDTHPRDVIELWTTDQHRLGLKPILRRVWCRQGQRPTAVVQHRYQWCYLYAFVHPPSGRTFWLLLPTVSIMAFTVALAEFAQAVGAGRGKQILLVCDGAGWHVSPQVQLPDGVHLPLLPPYSPELQPAERLWPLTNEALANRHFLDLETLQTVQAQRCLSLQTMPEVIRAHTNFHWWPQTA
jgi:DDE superfamily endonuclease